MTNIQSSFRLTDLNLKTITAVSVSCSDTGEQITLIDGNATPPVFAIPEDCNASDAAERIFDAYTTINEFVVQPSTTSALNVGGNKITIARNTLFIKYPLSKNLNDINTNQNIFVAELPVGSSYTLSGTPDNMVITQTSSGITATAGSKSITVNTGTCGVISVNGNDYNVCGGSVFIEFLGKTPRSRLWLIILLLVIVCGGYYLKKMKFNKKNNKKNNKRRNR